MRNDRSSSGELPNDGLPNDGAELSSVSSTLDELARRVTAAADRASVARNEALATELYEVERAMDNAARKLKNTVDRLTRSA
jgi:hypothetical protein